MLRGPRASGVLPGPRLLLRQDVRKVPAGPRVSRVLEQGLGPADPLSPAQAFPRPGDGGIIPKVVVRRNHAEGGRAVSVEGIAHDLLSVYQQGHRSAKDAIIEGGCTRAYGKTEGSSWTTHPRRRRNSKTEDASAKRP